MMIATWLIEIYLSKCNTLEDVIAAEAATSDVDSLRTELMLTEEDLRNFMTTYKVSMKPSAPNVANGELVHRTTSIEKSFTTSFRAMGGPRSICSLLGYLKTTASLSITG